MNRRTFLQEAGVLAAWVGVSVVLSGCSSDDDPSAPGTNPNPGDVAGRVSSNHGHTVAVTAAQITSGNAVTLTLTTGNGHTHTVSLTEAQIANIGAGSQVSETSSSASGHSHLASFN